MTPLELKRRRRGRGGPRWLAILLAAHALASCQAGPEGATDGRGAISSEAFVEAMVALRTPDLLDQSGYLPEGEPEQILGEHGLVPDDLRRFVEARGTDVALMAALWNEIERRVNELRNLGRS